MEHPLEIKQPLQAKNFRTHKPSRATMSSLESVMTLSGLKSRTLRQTP